MYSLGIIFFEMCIPLPTSMERANMLGKLREPEHVLPPIFKQPQKSIQGDIIYSLVDHEPSNRPRSSELLASEGIPGEVEDERLARDVLRHIHHAPYRSKLLAGLFPKPNELEVSSYKQDKADLTLSSPADPDRLDLDAEADFYPRTQPREMTYDLKDRSIGADEILFRNVVKDKVTSIFRRHGAVSLDGPPILPFSSHYSRKYDQVVKLLSSNDEFLQLPFDYTLTNARLVAKGARLPTKTYTFGEVYL